MADSDLQLAAALADGSIGRALEMVGGDLKLWRAAVIAGLEQFSARNFLGFGAGLWKLAETEGTRLFEADKEAEPEDDESDDDADNSAKEEAVKTEAGW